MLDGMRKASQGLIGRVILTVLFGLLIVSFVIWGVGDMFRGFVPDKVAEVGGAVDHRPAVPERAADRDVPLSRRRTHTQPHQRAGARARPRPPGAAAT